MTRQIEGLDHDRARQLLEDGASYREVARTLGGHRDAWRAVLPGYDWTPQQATAHSAMMRKFNALTWHGRPLA